jgi:exodeoxyribonuclease VII large subunit
MLSVSDISALIHNKLIFPETYKIKGELTSYSKRGGNIYAVIKDKDNSIDVISWNNPNSYENGDEVIVTGKINFYKKTSRINISAYSIEKKGLGDLFKKYLEYKDNFENKGYFDKDKKKQLPQIINSIGIITSSDGAALKDILYVLKEDSFKGDIYIKDCIVQGTSAAKSISNAIDFFNQNYSDKIDILLITRGGGSFEDLFQFSSDEVIKSIHNSKIFTVSAVGHETDTMLSDYVADYRAPTPSIGAKFITQIYLNKFNLLEFGSIKKNFIKNTLILRKYSLNIKLSRIKNFNIFDKILNEIYSQKNKLNNSIRHKYYSLKENIKKIKNKINLIEEKEKILNDGYCIIIDPESEKTINDIDEIGYDFILILKGKKFLIKPSYIIE